MKGYSLSVHDYEESIREIANLDYQEMLKGLRSLDNRVKREGLVLDSPFIEQEGLEHIKTVRKCIDLAFGVADDPFSTRGKEVVRKILLKGAEELRGHADAQQNYKNNAS